MGVIAGAASAIAGAIGSITAGIGGAVTAGLGAIGLDAGIAGIAGTIGGIAGPAIFGAGTGAGLSALTGGNPLTGAIGGGLGGGLIAGLGGASGALTGALGGSATAADAVLGAGAGGLASAVTGQNPLTGALTGGVSGALTGALGGVAGSGTGGSLQSTVNAVGTPPIPPDLDASGNPIAGTGTNGSGPLDANGNPATTLNPQSAQSAATGAAGRATGISSPALMLGALAAASSFFNKPTQGGYTIPTPAAAAANTGPTFTQPLAGATGATPVVPTVPNYYTYGQIPGGANYFNNNSLAAYGFNKGGALSRAREYVPNDNNRHVKGPGTRTSDSIPAMLSRDEYVLDAKDVSLIGGGSNERGARILNRERKTLNKTGGGALALARRSA